MQGDGPVDPDRIIFAAIGRFLDKFIVDVAPEKDEVLKTNIFSGEFILDARQPIDQVADCPHIGFFQTACGPALVDVVEQNGNGIIISGQPNDACAKCRNFAFEEYIRQPLAEAY